MAAFNLSGLGNFKNLQLSKFLAKYLLISKMLQRMLVGECVIVETTQLSAE